MKVTTNNPVIIDDIKVDPIDMYLSAEGTTEDETYNAGDIKVTTMNPVIIDEKNVSPLEYYSNVPGDEPSIQAKLDRKKKRQEFWNSAKGKWEKISNSPAAQFALQQLDTYISQKQGMSGSGDYQATDENKDKSKDTTPPEEKKMSTGAKIALGVGAALVVGLIIYAVMSGDSKDKGKTSK